MLNKKYLFEQAWQVEGLLKEYVSVHDRCLKEAGTFLSLFRHSDFEGLLSSAKEVFQKIDDEFEELISFKTRNFDQLHSVERQFFTMLLEYVEALRDTNRKLVVFFEALYLRSINQKDLSWFQYRKLGKTYEETRQKYLSIGETLIKHYNPLDMDFGLDNRAVKQNFSVEDLINMDVEEARKYQTEIDKTIFKIKKEDMAKFKFVKAS